MSLSHKTREITPYLEELRKVAAQLTEICNIAEKFTPKYRWDTTMRYVLRKTKLSDQALQKTREDIHDLFECKYSESVEYNIPLRHLDQIDDNE